MKDWQTMALRRKLCQPLMINFTQAPNHMQESFEGSFYRCLLMSVVMYKISDESTSRKCNRIIYSASLSSTDSMYGLLLYTRVHIIVNLKHYKQVCHPLTGAFVSFHLSKKEGFFDSLRVSHC